jgi:hypothetical protein
MFRAKKSGDITGFNTFRKNYHELLKHEKRPSFNSFLEETAQSKDIQKFYDLMKRLNSIFKWNVNNGSMREEYASLYEFLEAQKTELESEVRCPDPNHFSIIEWNIVMQSLKNRKSPAPDSMSYENWRQLDPELVPFMVKAFSETITSGDFDPEWFRFYVKSLPKKPGKLEARSSPPS